MSDRRRYRRVLQVHKIENNKTPSYLKDKLPTHRNEHNSFYEIRCKSNRYRNSFFPDAISSWNVFISDFDEVPTLGTLKNHIISFFRPKHKSFFGIHDPLGIRYIFQLRVGLSPLLSHKRRHKFPDTPSDNCNCNQGAEDTSHFLFVCPTYAIHRATLAVSVIEVLQNNNLNYLGNHVQLYLYGHDSISDIGNRTILLSTIKYIKDTHRFST